MTDLIKAFVASQQADFQTYLEALGARRGDDPEVDVPRQVQAKRVSSKMPAFGHYALEFIVPPGWDKPR